MNYRPKYRAGKDTNHFLVLKAFQDRGGGFEKDPNDFGVWRGNVRGLRVDLHDTSQYGGEFLDWMVIISDQVLFVEVKKPREVKDVRRLRLTENEYRMRQLKPGEKSFYFHSPARKVIVTTDDEFWLHVEALIDYIFDRDADPLLSSYQKLYFPNSISV